MVNKMLTLRSTVTGNRPPAGHAPGELYVNLADGQLGMVNTSGANQDLLAVRMFSTSAAYAIGDLVFYNGVLYSALAASAAGPFVAANWTAYVQKAGDTVSGTLTVNGALVAPTRTAGDSSTNVATTQFVTTAIANAKPPPGVTSFNTRTGAVTLALADVTGAGGAPIANPTFTGSGAWSVTPPHGDSSTMVATTAFVTNGFTTPAQVTAQLGSYALTSSVPVKTLYTPIVDGTATIGSDTGWAAGNHVHPTDTSRAPAAPYGYVQQAAGHGIVLGWNNTNITYNIDSGGATGALLPLSGGTMTGPLALNLNTTAASELAIVGVSGGNATLDLYDSGNTRRASLYYNIADASVYLRNENLNSYLLLDNSGNCTMAPTGSGNFYVIDNAHGYQNGGGSWIAISDARIKTVEADYAVGLDEVLQLRPVVYRYNGNDALAEGAPSMHQVAAEAKTQFVGLVAQEAETVMPGMVKQREAFIDGQPVDDLRALDNSELVYALVNAVKTLADRVESLESRLRAA